MTLSPVIGERFFHASNQVGDLATGSTSRTTLEGRSAQAMAAYPETGLLGLAPRPCARCCRDRMPLRSSDRQRKRSRARNASRLIIKSDKLADLQNGQRPSVSLHPSKIKDLGTAQSDIDDYLANLSVRFEEARRFLDLFKSERARDDWLQLP